MKFTPQNTLPLQAGAGVVRPVEPPRLVHLDDPASEVMTDFSKVFPITTTPDVTIDEALEIMKNQGVRLLLVLDPNEHVIGLITAADIQGNKPIELVQQQRIPHAEITVGMIMTPQSDIQGLPLDQALRLQVGHIAETLRQLERQHILVLDTDAAGKQTVCGLFSMSQIRKQLTPRSQLPDADHTPTVSELVQELG